LTDDEKTYWTSGNGLNYGNYQNWLGEAGYPVYNSPFAYDLSGYTNDLPVAWEEGDSLVTSDYDTQVFHAKTTLALQPAGQDPPGAQRSYLVLVAAQEYGPFPDYNIGYMVYPENLLSEVAYTPLSPEQLQVNGQTATDTGITDSNGLTWGMVVLNGPSGASLPLTFAATLSNPNDVAVPQTVVTNLQITANGNPLDPNDVAPSAAFVVGQAVTFALSTNLPPGIIATNFQWSFQGNYFNSQSNAVQGETFPQCSTVPYVDSNLLTLNQTTNWWVSGGLNPPSNYTAFLSCMLMFTNGNSQEYQTQGQFSMVRPQANIIATTGLLSFDTNFFSFDQNGVPTNVLGLHYGIVTPVGTPGITFSNVYTMPSGVSGTFQWVQVIDYAVLRYQTNIANGGWFTLSVSNVSDFTVPYPNVLATDRTEDSPGASIGNDINGPFCNSKHLMDSRAFEMYLEFQPPNGNWVPLRKVLWNYSGEAVLVDTNCAVTSWVGTNFSNNANPTDISADTYPRWTNSIRNLLNFTYGP
jgi:hypothetical protein